MSELQHLGDIPIDALRRQPELLNQAADPGALGLRLRIIEEAVHRAAEGVSWDFNPEYTRLILRHAATYREDTISFNNEMHVKEIAVFGNFGINQLDALQLIRTLHFVAQGLAVLAYHHGGDTPFWAAPAPRDLDLYEQDPEDLNDPDPSTTDRASDAP